MAEASPCLPDSIPGLPNDLALTILVRAPRFLHGSLRCVCSAWRDALKPLVVSALRNSLGISEVWLILLYDLTLITFCDPLLRRVSAPAPLPLCSPHSACANVIGAIGSQVFFFTLHACANVIGAPLPLCSPHSACANVIGAIGSQVIADDRTLSNIIIHCFDVTSMQLQSDFVHLKVPIRADFASAAFDGHLYVVGGIYMPNQYRDVVRVNVKMRTWEAMPDMHEIRVEAKAVVMQGCLYVIGGRSNGQHVHSGERWDPRRQEWMLEPELWPAHLFTSYEKPKVAVLLETLYALRGDYRKWELMRYERVSKLWTSLGCLSFCTCAKDKFYDLVGAGKELWVVINCKGNCDTCIMSCVPPIGTQPIRWRHVTTNTSSFGSQMMQYSIHGHVHV